MVSSLSTMFMIVNTLLQSALGGLIHVAGLHGAQAAAMNLAGQAVIHGINLAARPVSWIYQRVRVAYGAYSIGKLIVQHSSSNSTTTESSK
jgi:hypothetical protein